VTRAAPPRIDLTGEWSLRMNGPQGLVHMTLRIAQNGDALSGTAEGPMGTAELTGGIDDESFSFSLAIDSGPGFVMMFTGRFHREAEGDRLAGTMRAGEIAAEFSAERVERT
jgi:hypothetical protein